MNTLLAILKVTDARLDVILAGGLYHRFPWRHHPPLNVINIALHKLLRDNIVLEHSLHFSSGLKIIRFRTIERCC